MNLQQHIARMIGCRTDEVDDALKRESALSRRNLFRGGAALASGLVLVGGPLPLYVFTNECEWFVGRNYEEAMAAMTDIWGSSIGLLDEYGEPHLTQCDPRERMSIWTDDGGGVCYPDDDGARTQTLTMAEWAKRVGPGFLCTTEF